MTIRRPEFIAALDTLKRKGLPVFYGGYALLLLFNVAVFVVVFRRYPLGSHIQGNYNAALWYFAGLLTLIAAWSVFVVTTRNAMARWAPTCPTCGARATWRDRDTILSSGRCPKCGSAMPSD